MTSNAQHIANRRLNPNAYTHDIKIQNIIDADGFTPEEIDALIAAAEPAFIGLNTSGNAADAILENKGVMANTAILSLNALRNSDRDILTLTQQRLIESKIARAIGSLLIEVEAQLVDESELSADALATRQSAFVRTLDELTAGAKAAKSEGPRDLDDEVERGAARLGTYHPDAIHVTRPGLRPDVERGISRETRPEQRGPGNNSN